MSLPSGRIPFVIAAPTMRVPASVQGSLNAYLSMRAAYDSVVGRKRREVVHAAQAPFALGTNRRFSAKDPDL